MAFLSLPRGKLDWLRIVLVALAAYLAMLELLYALKYELPVPEQLSFEALFIFPSALLVAGTLVAFFLDLRLGAAFALVCVLLIVAAWVIPAH